MGNFEIQPLAQFQATLDVYLNTIVITLWDILEHISWYGSFILEREGIEKGVKGYTIQTSLYVFSLEKTLSGTISLRIALRGSEQYRTLLLVADPESQKLRFFPENLNYLAPYIKTLAEKIKKVYKDFRKELAKRRQNASLSKSQIADRIRRLDSLLKRI